MNPQNGWGSARDVSWNTFVEVVTVSTKKPSSSGAINHQKKAGTGDP